jgi:glutathione S-transferase
MPTVIGASVSPFVRKVRAFLAEKGIAYDLDPVIPFNVSPEFKKISPLGRIPAFRDGSVTLCDSSVICAYVERTHPEPALYPADAYEYARALWFEEFADGGLTPTLGKVFFQKIIAPRFFKQAPDETIIRKVLDEEAPPLLDYLEGQLGAAPMIVGTHFSIGDIGLASPFVNFRHAGHGVDAARWPKLARYVAGIHARPSFKALIEEEATAFGAAA